MCTPITSIPLQAINGEPATLADYSGKVPLVVNREPVAQAPARTGEIGEGMTMPFLLRG